MAPVQETKRDLRKSIKTLLSGLSNEDVANQSKKKALKVTQAVKAMPEYQNATRVSIYLSMPTGELSTKDIVADAIDQGKTVFVPYLYRVAQPDPATGKTKMAMLSLLSKEDLESLKPDSWGIPTLDPSSLESRQNALGGMGLDQKEIEANQGELDLILVPGMAFDQDCRRLGHGKGFYDRFLHEYQTSNDVGPGKQKMPFLAALALREQILPSGQEIPVAEHDWKMNRVVSSD